MSFHVPEPYRYKNHPTLPSSPVDGNNGFFIIPACLATRRPQLRIQASDGMGWEHVSVSTATRCPTWEEMCLVKRLFWDTEDCVMQLHPPQSQYVNNHPYCLHLWRPIGVTIPMPPSIMVGIKCLVKVGDKHGE